MEFSDPYDPMVAFDDYYEAVGGGEPACDLVRAAQAVARRAQRRRLAAPPSIIVGASYDPTHETFEAGGVVYSVIGDDEAPTGLPVFDDLHQRFADALPAPKYVRLDTPESYAAFREARRAPYIAALDARLTALEAAVAAHIADDHGGGKLDALQDAFDRHLAAGIGLAAQGGEPIALPMRACAEGKIECWQDGPEILCSIRLPGPDGIVRVATSATPAADAVEETLGCAIAEDLEPDEVIIIVPPMAQVLGASELVPEICGVALELLGCSGGAPFVGVMLPAADPATAAAMALLQRCQGGDRRACAEAAKMARSHRALIEDARDRLVAGQKAKANGRLS